MNTKIADYTIMTYSDKRKLKEEELKIYNLGSQMCIHREGSRKDLGITTQRCKDCVCYNHMEQIIGYNNRGLNPKELEERLEEKQL
jgi:hypothetical protein